MNVRELLLSRQGRVFFPQGTQSQPPRLLQAVELQLAELGYALTTRLRGRLQTLTLFELVAAQDFLGRTLAAALGANRKHTPLFRKFPQDVPRDTFELYVKKVLLHFLQTPGQPCLFCRRTGTTHVLSPCCHVVCDQCFDGASYSACPACEHQVDPRSPFFKPTPTPAPGRQRVIFKLIDLGEEPTAEARALLVSLCERRQALSPDDRDALLVITREHAAQVLSWLPAEIPLKENVATIFGTLMQGCDPQALLPQARAYLRTATDVLRLIAVYSGADAALQGELRRSLIMPPASPSTIAPAASGAGRWFGRIAQKLFSLGTEGSPSGAAAAATPAAVSRVASSTATASSKATAAVVPAKPKVVQLRVRRFKVAKLSRPLRKLLLELLEGLAFERLVEDLLRHRSYWVWVGEFLHPFEYARQFPRVALAFSVLRNQPLGDDALGRQLRARPEVQALALHTGGTYVYRNYQGRLEQAAAAADSCRFAQILSERPGELARRLDHALRLCLASGQSTQVVSEAFVRQRANVSTPVLLTLYGVLPQRHQPAPRRVFWPKGNVVKGVSAPDTRRPLPPELIATLHQAITAELLQRFAAKPAFASGVVDAALASIRVPFNERTASRSAVTLPRGSQVAIPPGTLLRLFLHWCQPEEDPRRDQPGKRPYVTTDIDLSIGFYDAQWKYVGVCSYYNLRFVADGHDIAQSSGDLRSAPFPDGASEFVDLHRERAAAQGIRYAVMVVNNYAGLPFAKLERGFAGLMIRDEAMGRHFDPRAVALKFDLQGENGVYLPMVVDLQHDVLHWLDAYAQGGLQFNNVATSDRVIQRLCPEMITYFESGARPSLWQLALLHAAARCQSVWLRGEAARRFTRRPGEDAAAYHQRLLTGRDADEVRAEPQLPAGPSFAALFHGDLDLAAGSTCYALFREEQSAVISASDLLS